MTFGIHNRATRVTTGDVVVGDETSRQFTFSVSVAAIVFSIPKFFKFSETPPNALAVPGVTFGLPIPSPRIMQERSSSDN